MRRPEDLLVQALVDSPEDIDLEVIAFEAGLKVRDMHLVGCEATLVGYGEKGIVTITTGISDERRRFSIAHEIGHWEMHRGQSFACRIEERSLDKAAKSKEREADDFAATLLMPPGLFKEAINTHKRSVSLSVISDLATTFHASFPATAIRYAELSGEPVIVIFSGTGTSIGRKWSTRSSSVPNHLWLLNQLDEDTFANDLLSGTSLEKRSGKMPAEAWFESVGVDQYELWEYSVRMPDGVYTLLHLTDEEMLSERLSAKRSWRL